MRQNKVVYLLPFLEKPLLPRFCALRDRFVGYAPEAYVDNGPDELASNSFVALQALANDIGGGYEHVILARKKDREENPAAKKT